MDLVQMLANAANNIASAGTDLVLTLSGVGGLALLVFYFSNVASQARRGQVKDGAGKFVAVILMCCCLITLHSVMNSASHQMALGDVTFGAITYLSEGKYGPAAVAVNACLTLLQALGACFALSGLGRLRRSLKDGHTGLSAGEDISGGVKRLICGVMLACNPQLLDALQNTLNIHW